jgi:hypothetical protein
MYQVGEVERLECVAQKSEMTVRYIPTVFHPASESSSPNVHFQVDEVPKVAIEKKMCSVSALEAT